VEWSGKEEKLGCRYAILPFIWAECEIPFFVYIHTMKRNESIPFL